jgi:hypothetical protein
LPDLPTPAVARQLVDVLGPVAVRHLVAALPEESDRSRRHQLLDLLTALGPAVVPHATLLLGDSRWFVVRNMILLLRTAGDQTSLPQVRSAPSTPTCGAAGGDQEPLRRRQPALGRPAGAGDQRPRPQGGGGGDRPRRLVPHHPGVQPLVRWCAAGTPSAVAARVRLRAIRSLGRLGDPAALPSLEPFFRDRLPQAALARSGSRLRVARRLPASTRGARSSSAVCARAIPRCARSASRSARRAAAGRAEAGPGRDACLSRNSGIRRSAEGSLAVQRLVLAIVHAVNSSALYPASHPRVREAIERWWPASRACSSPPPARDQPADGRRRPGGRPAALPLRRARTCAASCTPWRTSASRG